jgi:hypothetical protein
MQVFKSLDTESFSYKNIVQYWTNLANSPNRKSKIFFFIFSSLIPILGLMIIASFSIINPRYQKNHAYTVLMITTICLYAIASLLELNGTVMTTTITSVVSLIFGAYLYKRLVLRFF